MEAKEQLIKGSVIAADQTVFPYPIDSFPPLANSEVSSALHHLPWSSSGQHACVRPSFSSLALLGLFRIFSCCGGTAKPPSAHDILLWWTAVQTYIHARLEF